MVTVRIKNKYYLYLDIYVHGTRKWESLGIKLTSNKAHNKKLYELADQKRMERELQLLKQPEFLKQDRDLLEFIKEVQEIKGYRRMLDVYKHLKKFSNDKPIPFKSVSALWWEKAAAAMQKNGLSINTVALMLRLLKAILNRAVAEKYLPNNPLKNVKFKEEKKERVFLTFDDLKALSRIECAYPEIKRAFLFSCYTGLRLSDIEALTWKNITSDTMVIKAEKTGNEITIPLNNTAMKLLGKPSKGLVFNLPTKSTLSVTLKQWVYSAAIDKKVTFHTARHTFATLALSSDANIMSVKEILGHADVKTTLIYARLVDKKKKEDINKLPDL